jgi:pentatricopeptide repeat protein
VQKESQPSAIAHWTFSMARIKDFKYAKEELEKLIQDGHKVDRQCINVLLNLAPDISTGFGVYDEYFNTAGSTKLKPNVVSYTSLIELCGRFSDAEKACELKQEMERQNIEPDFLTFLALIKACKQTGQASNCLIYFSEMRQRGIGPNVYMYSVAMEMAFKLRKPDLAVALFEEMQQKGLKISLAIYAQLLNHASTPLFASQLLHKVKTARVFFLMSNLRFF